MSIFETAKEIVTVPEAARRYGLHANRGSMALCPFHDDHTPSLKLNRGYYFCFGCGATGDVSDLTAKLLNLTPYEAARRLLDDIGASEEHTEIDDLEFELEDPNYVLTKEDEYACILQNYEDLLFYWSIRYRPKSPDEQFDSRYVLACHDMPYAGYMYDQLESDDKAVRKSAIEELGKGGRIAWISELTKNEEVGSVIDE